MISRRHLVAGLAAAPFAAPALRAQSAWPDKPVRVIVPFGPGGLADVTIRIVGERLSQRLGQQIVVVNQPGAGGVTAARAVLSSPADGYTLALLTNGTAISVSTVKSLGFDPLKDFAPVSSLGFFDFVIATAAEQPYRNLGDLIAAAREKPGKLNIGVINIGSTQHLSAVLLKTLAKVDVAIIPHRTTPDAITAATRRDVDAIIDGFSATGSLIKGGQLKALATSGPKRSANLPDVPSVIESGIPGFDVTSWNAVFAPAGTPQAVIDRLNAEIRAVLAEPAVLQRLLDLGIEGRAGSPAEIGERLGADIRRWGEVIASAGITPQ